MATERVNEAGEEQLPGGIEDEADDGVVRGIRPWDPALIRISTKTYSLRQVVDEIGDETINLAPDFQRAYVWREAQQSQLIESILLGIPLPSFYFSADPDGNMQVVDGVQRLTTVVRFARGDFALDGVEYIKHLRGCTFAALDAAWRRRFHTTQILVHVIEPQTPPEVKFDIFRRINTGGTPLTPQQIRHCISHKRSRDLLARMTETDAFRLATRHAFDRDVLMTARELALRFVAFRAGFDLDAYRRVDTLDDFLIDVTRRLDDVARTPDDELAAIEGAFARAMVNAAAVFGAKAFRRWPTDAQRIGAINRALFDSWAVALSEVDEAMAARYAEAIRERARDAMTHDAEYVRSFTIATGDTARIEYRLRKAREIVREALR